MRPTHITCGHCGTESAVASDGPIPTYCSGKCRSALSTERARSDGRYDKSLAESRRRTIERQVVEARPCPYCGTPMTHPRRVQCGAVDCRHRYHAERQGRRSRAIKEATGEWPHRKYAEQNREYERRRRQEQPHWRTRYPEVAAQSDARRRSLKAQADVGERLAPLDVHERDGWTCQLCQHPIDRTIAWPDSMSPSIDHIVPLSRGGLHALANVQSAHLGCNSSKRDREAATLGYVDGMAKG